MDSGASLFAGYVLIVAICWSERAVTYFHEKYQSRHGSWKFIGLRTLLYGIATTLRLWYMLITMYFNIGFFIVVIFGLTSGQLVMEYLKATRNTPTHPIQEGGDHRHSGSSGYTSLEYKDPQQMHVIGSSSSSESNGKRRSRHRDDVEEEQRLFSGSSDHEEYELTRNAGTHGRVSETAF
ncbi:hypothetical protein BJV82DRAFT_578388 [Fennellomyces sp. T-0311]|nr:hypothetical protein BJV82DRAFT_578388 [Fennellomyces sp. T-0311]